MAQTGYRLIKVFKQPANWLRSDMSLLFLAGYLVGFLTVNTCRADQSTIEISQQQVTDFDRNLRLLVKEWNLPGLSVGVFHRGQTVFAQGYGYADFETRRESKPDTTYRIASVTKPITATVVLQLVDEGKIDLDTPMVGVPGHVEFASKLAESKNLLARNYNHSSNKITIRHHLTHTSQGSPGETFQYNGALFNSLGRAIENSSGSSIQNLFHSRIIDALKLQNTAPSQSKADEKILNRLAKPYYTTADGNMVLSEFPNPEGGASAGIVSTVGDLGLISSALDDNRLLPERTKQSMWTPTVSTNKKTLPYSLGWFIKELEGQKIVFHSGWWPNAYSALFVKIPNSELTFVALSNSGRLSGPFGGMTDGEIERSPFAVAFLRHIVELDIAWKPPPIHIEARNLAIGGKTIRACLPESWIEKSDGVLVPSGTLEKPIAQLSFSVHAKEPIPNLIKEFVGDFDAVYGEDGPKTWLGFWNFDDEKTEVVIFMPFKSDVVVVKHCYSNSAEDQIAKSIIGNEIIATLSLLESNNAEAAK